MRGFYATTQSKNKLNRQQNKNFAELNENMANKTHLKGSDEIIPGHFSITPRITHFGWTASGKLVVTVDGKTGYISVSFT